MLHLPDLGASLGCTGLPDRPPAVHSLLVPVGGLGVPPGLAFPKGPRPALGPEWWVRPGQTRGPGWAPQARVVTCRDRSSTSFFALESSGKRRGPSSRPPSLRKCGAGPRSPNRCPVGWGAPTPRPGMRCSRRGGPGGSEARGVQRGRGCQPGEQQGAGGGEGRGGVGWGDPGADRGHKAHRRAEPEARLCGLDRVPRRGAPPSAPSTPLTPPSLCAATGAVGTRLYHPPAHFYSSSAGAAWPPGAGPPCAPEWDAGPRPCPEAPREPARPGGPASLSGPPGQPCGGGWGPAGVEAGCWRIMGRCAAKV